MDVFSKVQWPTPENSLALRSSLPARVRTKVYGRTVKLAKKTTRVFAVGTVSFRRKRKLFPHGLCQLP